MGINEKGDKWTFLNPIFSSPENVDPSNKKNTPERNVPINDFFGH